jgi:hypothetical protein
MKRQDPHRYRTDTLHLDASPHMLFPEWSTVTKEWNEMSGENQSSTYISQIGVNAIRKLKKRLSEDVEILRLLRDMDMDGSK